MSVHTTYDEMRDELRKELSECLRKARELVVSEDVWGYDEMRKDYAMDVYVAVKNARDII